MSDLCPNLHALIEEAQLAILGAKATLREFIKGSKTKEQLTQSITQANDEASEYEKFCKESTKIGEISIWAPDYISLLNIAKLNDIKLRRIFETIRPDSIDPVTKRLVRLDLSHMRIKQLGNTLSGLTHLYQLELMGNQLQDITGLDDLKNLRTIYLQGNDLRSLSGLGKLTELNILAIDRNINLFKLTGVEKLTKLTSLSASTCQITSFDEISDLKELTSLNLNTNGITSLNTLKNMNQLISLSFNHNKIASLSGIENLSNLEVLEMSDNLLTSVTQLSGLEKLTRLFLAKNQLRTLSGIENLTRIHELSVIENPLDSLIDLSNFSDLWQLYITPSTAVENAISNLSKALPDLLISYEY